MQITVYGATGTFGRRLVSQLHERGHTTIAAHRGSGVDTVTGEGVAEAAEGSDVLVDCVNRMTMRADRAIDFFSRSSRSIALAAAEAARMMAEAIDAGEHGTIEAAGPEISDFAEIAARIAEERTRAAGIAKTPKVIGMPLPGPASGDGLIPDSPRLSEVGLDDWLRTP